MSEDLKKVTKEIHRLKECSESGFLRNDGDTMYVSGRISMCIELLGYIEEITRLEAKNDKR